MIIKLDGIQEYTEEEKKKFEGTKPLLKSVQDYYPDRFLINYRKFEQPKEFDLYEARQGKPIDLAGRKIVFGIKAPEEQFTQYDFLWCPDGPAFVVHQRVLDKFNELCPNDIQALPMVIKNVSLKGEQFENKDFWFINVLAIVDSFDKNYIHFAEDGFPTFKQKVLLNHSMKDHLVARDNIFYRILVHPSLARHFIESRGVQFLTDEESP
jgi:hypothetical protein